MASGFELSMRHARGGRALASADVAERIGPGEQATMADMAVAVKRLDVNVGDLVEIDGREYDVVSDKAGGVALEPAITRSVPEIHAEHSGRPLASEEFERIFGDLPSDGEG